MSGSTKILLVIALASGCGGGNSTPDAGPADAAVKNGTMSLTWRITDMSDNALTCDDVAAGSVTITAQPTAGGFAVSAPFTCSDGTGSAEVAPGTYDVTVRLTSTLGTLASSAVMSGVEVVANQDVALGEQVFAVDPSGNFSFSIDTGASGGNCADAGSGGGALTQLEIRLLDGSGSCVPTTFAIDDGTASPPPDYQSDCAGATIGCFAKDVTFSVAGADSGPHMLDIRGQKAGLDCYSRTADLIIPGAGLTRALGSQMLFLASTPQCDPNAPDAGPTPDAGTADAL